jgi:hypothetical protein
MLDWRGIEDGQECSRCGGAGTLAYSTTATWHGGAGGSTVTTDVCATCWGSGTKHPWPSWRKLKALELERDTIQEYADQVGSNLTAAEGTLKERDEQIATLKAHKCAPCPYMHTGRGMRI